MNALLIAYFFPPFGQTSSRRSAGMTKYFPDFGCKPVVVTREWTPDNGLYDPTIGIGLPENIEIHRIPFENDNTKLFPTFQKRLYQTLLPHKNQHPFGKDAINNILEVIKQNEIEIIWATFPPFDGLTLAKKISRLTGIPWVADLRDIYQFADSWKSRLLLPLRIHSLNMCIRDANAIITVSEGFAETLNRRIKRKVHVVPNGFDHEFILPERRYNYPKFEIVYTGGINIGNPDFRPLLDALEKLCECKLMDKNDIIISFYGKGNEKRLKQLYRHSFSSTIRNCQCVTNKESIEIQTKALILLQATRPGSGWMTSKIYEYLVARRPILAFPRDGTSIEKLLNETRAGVCCTTIDEIAFQLLKWYNEWKKTGDILWDGDVDKIMKFTRKEQAKQTVFVFEEVISGCK